ncbi:4Fe-4S dicluster domain-containing protein [Pontiella agarivorans]|uniref:4Fe-4S dicluster domain-containing protein n=1 Tax=Pontiella agarivorans TaxID=3038953 RepID=A0ABU5N026_9BACT|nr:4Fe-4S dicluster domain-containing protein [Pontiella agarivorans]MDZ8119795.1 4Fe-4S dicluster domain-containing protein [Pontiella agarivorans]
MRRTIKIDWDNLVDFQMLETPFPRPERIYPGLDKIDPATFPAFLDEIGLIGMGGGGYPTSKKLQANLNAHTLVINGIECEPGISIDKSVLLQDSFWVAAGANACVKATGSTKIVLAVQNDPDLIKELNKYYGEFIIVGFNREYPAGAEKLIIEKLTGKRPPAGTRPFELGFLIQNVVTLRAIGRAIIDGIPVVERPLTLAMPSSGFYKNIIVPVGIEIRKLLEIYNLPYDASMHLITDSGLMMGREVDRFSTIRKTTLAIFILRRDEVYREERPCTRCGACNAACPLGLHPFTLTEKINKGKTTSTAFTAQMTECFLCGVCAAVCPSGIPLIETLQKGKRCL